MSPRSLAPLGSLAVLLTLGATPSLARAEVGVAGFAPSHQQQLVGLDDFTYDSDWFPMNAPLQLRLVVVPPVVVPVIGPPVVVPPVVVPVDRTNCSRASRGSSIG